MWCFHGWEWGSASGEGNIRRLIWCELTGGEGKTFGQFELALGHTPKNTNSKRPEARWRP